jgi:GH24 family phage-related lysozyme (muramidase)
MINDYKTAADTRKRGILGNITDQLVAGNSIGGSIKGGISDTFKAKMTGIKEKFDPINIAKTFTGNLGGALVGKMLGRSEADISHFTGIKIPGSSSANSISTSFYTTATTNSRLKKGESLANIAAKLFAFMKKINEYRVKQYELNKDFEEEKDEKVQRRRKEILQAIEDSKKEIPEKIKEEVKKDTKKSGKKSEPKKEIKPPEQPKKTSTKTTQVKTTKQKPPPLKTNAPATTTTAPSVTAAAAPVVESVPAVSTAIKVAAGASVAAATGTALAKIKGHEGYAEKAYYDPKRDAKGNVLEEHYSIGYGHQISNEEVKKGYIDVSGKKIPVLGVLGKDTVISKEDADKLASSEYKKYEDSAKKITNFDKLNTEAQSAFIDMTYNMGTGWFNPKKWPKLHHALEQLDMDSAANSIMDSKYYKDTGKRAQENVLLIRNGLKSNRKEIPKQVNVGQKLNEVSVKNQELAESTDTINTVIVNNSVNNINGGIVNKQYTNQPTKDVLPTYMAQ